MGKDDDKGKGDTDRLPWLQKFLSAHKKKNEGDKKIDGENDAGPTASPCQAQKTPPRKHKRRSETTEARVRFR